MTEEESIELICGGGKGIDIGVKALWQGHAQRMLGHFINGRVSQHEANDLLQDTFVKIVAGSRSYSSEKGKATAWIWQIARNCLMDHFRKQSRYKEVLREHLELEMFLAGNQLKGVNRGMESSETEDSETVDVNAIDEFGGIIKDPAEADSLQRQDDDTDDGERGYQTSNSPRSVAECVSAGLEAFARKMPARAYVLELQMDGASIKEIGLEIGRTISATREYLSQCKKKIRPYIAHCTELLPS